MDNMSTLRLIKDLSYYIRIRLSAIQLLPKGLERVRHSPLPKGSKVIVACVRNEDLYLEHWIKFHLEVGFCRIYIYDNAFNENDASNTYKILREFIEGGDVVYIRWRDVDGLRVGTEKNKDRSKLSIQELAYFHFSSRLSRQIPGTAYIKLDVDEYAYDPTCLYLKNTVINKSFRLWGYDFGGRLTETKKTSVISRFTYRPLRKTHFKQFSIAGSSIWAPNAHFDYPGLIQRIRSYLFKKPWFEISNLTLNHYRLKTYTEFIRRKVHIPLGYTKGDYEANEYDLLNSQLSVIEDRVLLERVRDSCSHLL